MYGYYQPDDRSAARGRLLRGAGLVAFGAAVLGRRRLGTWAGRQVSGFVESEAVRNVSTQAVDAAARGAEALSERLSRTSWLGHHFAAGPEAARRDVADFTHLTRRAHSAQFAQRVSRDLPGFLPGWSPEKIGALRSDEALFRTLFAPEPFAADPLAALRGRLHGTPGAFQDALHADAQRSGRAFSDVLDDAARDLQSARTRWGTPGRIDPDDPLQKALSGVLRGNLAAEAARAESPLRKLAGLSRKRVSAEEVSRIADHVGAGPWDTLSEAGANARFVSSVRQEASGAAHVYDFSGLRSIAMTAGDVLSDRVQIPLSPFQAGISLGQLFPFLSRAGDAPLSKVTRAGLGAGEDLEVFLGGKRVSYTPGDPARAAATRIEEGQWRALRGNKTHLKNWLGAQQEAARGDNGRTEAGALARAWGRVKDLKGGLGVEPGSVPLWDQAGAFFRKFRDPNYAPNALRAASQGGLQSESQMETLIRTLGDEGLRSGDGAVSHLVDGLRGTSAWRPAGEEPSPWNERRVDPAIGRLADRLSQQGDAGWAEGLDDLKTFYAGVRTDSGPVRRILADLSDLSGQDRARYLDQTASYGDSRRAERLGGLDLSLGAHRVTRRDVLRRGLIADLARLSATGDEDLTDVAARLSAAGHAEASRSVLGLALGGTRATSPEALASVNALLSREDHGGLRDFLARSAKARFHVLDLHPSVPTPGGDFTERGRLILERTDRPSGFGAGLSAFKSAYWTGSTSTPGSRAAYFFSDRLHGAFGSLGAGLPAVWRTSPLKLALGLSVGRVLPLFLLPEAHKAYNRVTRDVPFLRPFNLDARRADLLDLTSRLSHPGHLRATMTALLPGLDFYFDDRSAKDDAGHRRGAGETAVRRGRGWLFGSREAVFGGAITHYLPSAARIARSDWQAAPNVHANSARYWRHWGGPLNPANWGKGAYWREQALQKDRPYLTSAPLFDPDLPTSAPLNFLFGWMKPRRVYHPEYLPKHLGGRLESLSPASRPTSPFYDPKAVAAERATAVSEAPAPGRRSFWDRFRRGSSAGTGGSSRAPYVSRRAPLRAGWSPRVPRSGRIPDARKDPLLRRLNLARTLRGEDPLNPEGVSPEERGFIRGLKPPSTLERAVYHAQEIGGLYGWMASALFPHVARPVGRTEIALPNRGLGLERKFWDAEWGGAGGNAGDVLRRFLPHRRRSIADYDPAPNRMPSWLPQKYRTGDPYCVSPDTLIELDGNRIVPADTVVPGDIIRTHKGNLRPVRAVKRRAVKIGEGVYKVTVGTLPSFPFTVSEEHPILAVTQDSVHYCTRYTPRPGKPHSDRDLITYVDWRQAKDLRVGDYVAYPRPIIDRRAKRLDLMDYFPEGSPYQDRIYYGPGGENYVEIREFILSGVPQRFAWGQLRSILKEKGWTSAEYESVQNTLKNYDSDANSMPRYIDITPDIAQMFGYWVAEGCASEGQICFGFHRKEKQFHDHVVSTLNGLIGREAGRYELGENSTSIRFHSKPLGNLLIGLFGSGARNKHLPNWWETLPQETLHAFLKGLFDGDGCAFKTGNRPRIALKTTSRQIAYQIRHLLLTLDIVASVSSGAAQTSVLKNGKEIHSGKSYHVNVNSQQAEKLSVLLRYGLEEHHNLSKSPGKQWFSDDSYFYHRINKISMVDESEVIGFEVDIEDSFCVAGVATHNTKLPVGELRLPGEAYERTHPGVASKLLRIRASSLGKSEADMAAYLVKKEGDGFTSRAAEMGTRMHRVLQRRWRQLGILEADEVEVYDKALNVTGHIDAILRLPKRFRRGYERTIVDIKTKSGSLYKKIARSGKPEGENLDQLLFYMHATGIKKGLLTYVNRDDVSQVKQIHVRYDDRRLRQAIARMTRAREDVLGRVSRGEIGRGELYDPVTKYEILSDTSPHSEEFSALRQWAGRSRDSLTAGERQRLDRADTRRQKIDGGFELHAYRFRPSRLRSRNVRVEQVLSRTAFRAKGGQVYRLSGLSVDASSSPYATPDAQWESFGVRAGSRVRVAVDGRGGRTQAAVVRARGRDVGRALLRSGAATENAQDFSPTAVRTRFTKSQRTAGRLWEWFAHQNTPWHTKFLPVRSGLEQYERTQVYGKGHGGWEHPLRDYLWPTLASMTNKNPLAAAALGGAIGGMFFSWAGGRTAAAAVGAGVGVALSLFGSLRRALGKPFIPRNVRKRWQIQERYDALAYVKFRRLAAIETRLAQSREGTNVDDLDGTALANVGPEEAEEAEGLSGTVRQLRARQKKLRSRSEGARPARARALRRESAALGDEIARLQAERGRHLNRGRYPVGPHAQAALAYRQRARATVRGALEGSSWEAALSALPKPVRSSIADVVRHGSAREKAHLYRLLPDYQKAMLGYALGAAPKDIPKPKALDALFAKAPLPDESWAGWRADASLELIETKDIASRRDMDPMDFGVFPGQVDEAQGGSPEALIPSPRQASPRRSLATLRRDLHALLIGRGMTGVSVEVEESPGDKGQDAHHADVTLDVTHRREHAAFSLFKRFHGRRS